MGEEIKKMVEWFEELLETDGIKLAFGNDFSDDCSTYGHLYDIDSLYLTRRVLYFDKSTKKLMTHAPGGSNWRRNSNIRRLAFGSNVRWVMSSEIRGENIIEPSWVLVEDNNINILKSRDIRSRRFEELCNSIVESIYS